MDNQIKWIEPTNCAKIHQENEFDVKISKEQGLKTRLKIVIQNCALDGIPYAPRVKVGIADNRVYFALSETEGYAGTKTEYRTVIKIPIRYEKEKK